MTGAFRDDRGSSLIEVLIASSILVVAIVSLAQLLATEVEANRAAGATTVATLIAAQKIEDLRGAAWESVRGATGEFVDHVDRAGRHIDGAATQEEFTRTWSVTPLSADPDNTMLIKVSVKALRVEAKIVDVRTRTVP